MNRRISSIRVQALERLNPINPNPCPPLFPKSLHSRVLLLHLSLVHQKISLYPLMYKH